MSCPSCGEPVTLWVDVGRRGAPALRRGLRGLLLSDAGARRAGRGRRGDRAGDVARCLRCAAPWWRRLTARVLAAGARAAERSDGRALRGSEREVDAAVTGAADRALLTALLAGPPRSAYPRTTSSSRSRCCRAPLDLLTLQEQVARDGLPTGAAPAQGRSATSAATSRPRRSWRATPPSEPGRLFLTETTPGVPGRAAHLAALGRRRRESRKTRAMSIVAAPGRGALHRFRCNSYSDARCARWVADTLQRAEASHRDRHRRDPRHRVRRRSPALDDTPSRAGRPRHVREPSMNLPGHVTIVEVGPRDGLQNEAGADRNRATRWRSSICSRRRARRVIEVSSFVRADWVPQLADAAAVVGAIDARGRARATRRSCRT